MNFPVVLNLVEFIVYTVVIVVMTVYGLRCLKDSRARAIVTNNDRLLDTIILTGIAGSVGLYALFAPFLVRLRAEWDAYLAESNIPLLVWIMIGIGAVAIILIFVRKANKGKKEAEPMYAFTKVEDVKISPKPTTDTPSVEKVQE